MRRTRRAGKRVSASAGFGRRRRFVDDRNRPNDRPDRYVASARDDGLIFVADGFHYDSGDVAELVACLKRRKPYVWTLPG